MSDATSSTSITSTVQELNQMGVTLCLHRDLATECSRCEREFFNREKYKQSQREKLDIEEAIALQKAMKLSQVDSTPKSPLASFHNQELRTILTKQLTWVCELCSCSNPGLEKQCSTCLQDDKNPPKKWECPDCAWDNSGYHTQCTECQCFRPLPRLKSVMLTNPNEMIPVKKPIFQLKPLNE
jgi:hypothetical protein